MRHYSPHSSSEYSISTATFVRIGFIFLEIYSSDNMSVFVALDLRVRAGLILYYIENVVEIVESELLHGE